MNALLLTLALCGQVSFEPVDAGITPQLEAWKAQIGSPWFWGATVIDYDEDGDSDIVLTSHNNTPAGVHNSKLLRNNFVPDGVISFTDVTDAAFPGGIDFHENKPHVWDVDGDGDLDLVCTAGRFDEAHQQQDQGAFAVFAAGRWQTCSDSPWTHGGIAQETAYQNVVRFAQPQKQGTSGTLAYTRDGNELVVNMDLSEPAQNPWRRQVIYAGGNRLLIRDWCDPTAEWGFCKPSEDDTSEPYVSEATATAGKLDDGFLSMVEW